jgi:hypothetical protein
VLVLGLVFPREKAAFPDIDEAGVALGAFGGCADDLDVFLEAIVFAGGIGLGGGRLARKMAEVDKVLVAGGALGELGPGPLVHEFIRSQPARLLSHRGYCRKPSSACICVHLWLIDLLRVLRSTQLPSICGRISLRERNEL